MGFSRDVILTNLPSAFSQGELICVAWPPVVIPKELQPPLGDTLFITANLRTSHCHCPAQFLGTFCRIALSLSRESLEQAFNCATANYSGECLFKLRTVLQHLLRCIVVEVVLFVASSFYKRRTQQQEFLPCAPQKQVGQQQQTVDLLVPASGQIAGEGSERERSFWGWKVYL